MYTKDLQDLHFLMPKLNITHNIPILISYTLKLLITLGYHQGSINQSWFDKKINAAAYQLGSTWI